MCVYCKAASTVLDKLWEDEDFRVFFYGHGYDLSDLGPMTHDVFVPAYLAFKRRLTGGAIELLEAQVTEDILSPLARRPNFRAMWSEWDQAMRSQFLREQSEIKLSTLLVMAYAAQLSDGYKWAFLAHVNGQRV
ncbi:MAG: hypothetical protein JXJ20_14930 [Anaerolineae bacterium]|jgi:hypothetical protein|nr:hypothetical protein [Anaerolineae bacterium]